MSMINKKTRDSNFELLRIILISLVILGHANMWFIGSGYNNETERIVRTIVQVICIPAVNGFILISGWFGIKSDIKRIFYIIFQLLICTVPVAIFMCIKGQINIFSLDGINEYILGGNNYWFIIDYIGLLLFAPILNIIVQNSDKAILKFSLLTVLLLVFPIDVILRSDVLGTSGGYSLIWFIYLYLLARYMRLYGLNWFEKNKWVLLIACTILQSILLYFHLIGNRYTNPLILIPAMSLILICKDFSIKSKVINYIASGTLMAYMLHMHPCFWTDIAAFLRKMYNSDGYFLYIIKVIFIVFIFYLFAVVLDKLQAMLWKYISRFIFFKQ